jgi:hypothetical protein
MRAGSIDVFQESITIPSQHAIRCCGICFETRNHWSDPYGGYTGNIKYRKKAMMWLVYREQTDGCHILHGRNGGEHKLPELPNLSVDRFCAETKTVYEFKGCYWHVHACQPFRDVPTVAGDTLAERYE